MTALFRREFSLQAPSDITLEIRALRGARAWIDGREIPAVQDSQDWKSPNPVALASLSPGAHLLLVSASNSTGPPAVRIFSASSGLSSGEQWQVSADGKIWVAPRTAAASPDLPLADRFESAGAAAARLAPVCAVLFALIFACSWFCQVRGFPWLDSFPSVLRWSLLAAWAALTANNWHRLPVGIGFDVPAHLAYIDAIFTRHRIPLANEGWQMFQSPLYYLLAAPLQRLEYPPFGPLFYLRVLRLIGFACGAAQVELTYRALKLAFPRRGDLQGLGLIIGGLLPMNLYLSQTIGNEPLSALLSAAAIVSLWSLSSAPSTRKTSRFVVLGALLGLAMLTKATAVLLTGLSLLFIVDRASTPKKALRAAAVVVAAAAAVCGWYYLRNWLLLGRPFVGGWDPSRGFSWWQSPGYRTPGHYLSAGRALSRPVFSSFGGFWDAFYSTFWLDGSLCGTSEWATRPPWNYTAMIAAAWWSLLPSAAILIGTGKALFGGDRRRPLLVFSALSVAVYLLAMLSLDLKLPYYSVDKATYTLGLIPCFAALAASGFETLGRGRLSRAALHGAAACWAALCYGAYFVR